MADETTEPKPESLDSTEAAQVAEEAQKAATDPANDTASALKKDNSNVQKFDFRRPIVISDDDYRTIKTRNNDFTSLFTAKLSGHLRLEFAGEVDSVESITYGKYTSELASGNVIILFTAEPLEGVGILEISPALALAMTDKVLGGKGVAVGVERELTDIEFSLVDDAAIQILEEWCLQWRQEMQLRPNIIGHETSGQYLQMESKDSAMMLLTLECKFNNITDKIKIAVPFSTIGPVIKKIQSKKLRLNTKAAVVKQEGRWSEEYSKINVPVTAAWPEFDVPLREVAGLKIGDIVEMPTSVLQETRIFLNGLPRFSGVVGVEGDVVAVQIVRKITHENKN